MLKYVSDFLCRRLKNETETDADADADAELETPLKLEKLHPIGNKKVGRLNSIFNKGSSKHRNEFFQLHKKFFSLMISN